MQMCEVVAQDFRVGSAPAIRGADAEGGICIAPFGVARGRIMQGRYRLMHSRLGGGDAIRCCAIRGRSQGLLRVGAGVLRGLGERNRGRVNVVLEVSTGGCLKLSLASALLQCDAQVGPSASGSFLSTSSRAPSRLWSCMCAVCAVWSWLSEMQGGAQGIVPAAVRQRYFQIFTCSVEQIVEECAFMVNSEALQILSGMADTWRSAHLGASWIA